MAPVRSSAKTSNLYMPLLLHIRYAKGYPQGPESLKPEEAV
jgi:hypothetical protein